MLVLAEHLGQHWHLIWTCLQRGCRAHGNSNRCLCNGNGNAAPPFCPSFLWGLLPNLEINTIC